MHNFTWSYSIAGSALVLQFDCCDYVVDGYSTGNNDFPSIIFFRFGYSMKEDFNFGI